MDEMLPNFHSYHLDDAPDLRSCALLIRRTEGPSEAKNTSLAIARRRNFYGRDHDLKAHYVRDVGIIARDRAPTDTYRIEWLEEGK